jgi:hypothetical protein
MYSLVRAGASGLFMRAPVAHFDKRVASQSGMNGGMAVVVDCLADLLEVKSRPSH